ncbi:MAG: hypothetical protein OHK0057_32910 [Thermoflexibacter sp.]
MKHLLCFVCYISLFTFSFGQANNEVLTLSPTQPQVGKSVEFAFNPSLTSLARAKEISSVVYLVDDKEIKAEDITLFRKGDIYTGKIALPRNTIAFFLTFRDKSTSRSGKMVSEGFTVRVFDKNQQFKDNNYALLAKGYYEWCGLVGRERDNALIIGWLEHYFKLQPQHKRKYLDLYFTALKNEDTDKSKPIIYRELESIYTEKNLSENDLVLLQKWYGNLYDEEKKVYFTNLLKSRYPQGDFAVNERYLQFVQEPDIYKKKLLYENFKRDFPKSENLKSMQLSLAYLFANQKNWEGFESIVSSIKMKDKAFLYNSLAWEWAEQNINLDKAQELASQTAEYARYQLIQSAENKPSHISNNQWKEQLKINYATFADTYAYVLFRLGKYKSALPYFKDASEIFFNNIEVNERYTACLEQVTNNESISLLKNELERLVKAGVASEKMKRQLQQCYGKEKGNLQGYDAYLESLESELKKEIRNNLAKQMVSESAPDFKMIDLEGKEVSLADFKGKIVLLNFWATWCEDCAAFFPFLEKIRAKYNKVNSAVVFLFVSTWENASNRQEVVKDFLAKNKYDFPAFIDKNNSVSLDFKVNHIFAKIVIDRNGKIRFKQTGVSENQTLMAEELSQMIEIVNEMN